MMRLGCAVACALLLHAGLFWIGSGWFVSRTVPPCLSRFVAVTMSYQQEPKQTVVAKQETVEPPEIVAPDKPRAPAKLPEKTAPARAERPEDNKAASRVRPEKMADAGAATAPDTALDSTASEKESPVDAAFVREAVPLYKSNPPPRYPAAARRRGQQGTVVLSVYVDVYGRVANLWLFESSGYRVLDIAALQAVRGWIFEPGRQGGTKVAMWVNVPVRFELK